MFLKGRLFIHAEEIIIKKLNFNLIIKTNLIIVVYNKNKYIILYI